MIALTHGVAGPEEAGVRSRSITRDPAASPSVGGVWEEDMFKTLARAALGLTTAMAIAMPAAHAADVVLKASHQWPGGKGDVRDEMVQILAREVAKADVGLEIKVYPGQSLFKAREQWGAMTKGQLDISAFPLDYASGRHPQFSATLMPGLVRNHDRATRLNDSPFMQDIKKIVNDAAEFSKASPEPPLEELWTDILADAPGGN